MHNRGKFMCIQCGREQKVEDALWADKANNLVFRNYSKGDQKDIECVYSGVNEVTELTIRNQTKHNGCIRAQTLSYKLKTPTGETKKMTSMLRSNNRICPECFDEGNGIYKQLLPDAGFYPSYYIGLTGVMETGKTVFMNAISRQETFFSSDETEIRSLSISGSADEENGYTLAPMPTALSSVNCITFTVRKNFKDVAKIYLTDSAGELLGDKEHDSEDAAKAIQFFAEFADAIILLFDPRYLKSKELDGYRSDRQAVSGSVSLILNDVSHKKIHTAVVMSGADRIKDIVEEKKGIHDEKNQHIVLTAKSELLKNNSLNHENVIRHIALARDVLESCDVETKYSKEQGCFIVSSGRDDFKDGKKVINYNQTMNIKYPLAWILNQLGVIDIQ